LGDIDAEQHAVAEQLFDVGPLRGIVAALAGIRENIRRLDHPMFDVGLFDIIELELGFGDAPVFFG
jgi:hypothetical protein